MREYKSPPDPGEQLSDMLTRSVIDDYVRKNKHSRDYPRKKHEQAAGRPKLLNATRTQIQQAKHLTHTKPEKRLTA
jgi:hypothetical protein